MYLFTYGTLQQGKSNHHYLENSEYIGQYFTNKDYALIVSGLPYMVERKRGGGVEGELYKIDKEVLHSIDKLEGHPHFYERKEIIVYDFEKGHPIVAYAYIHPDNFFGNYPWKYEQRRKY